MLRSLGICAGDGSMRCLDRLEQHVALLLQCRATVLNARRRRLHGRLGRRRRRRRRRARLLQTRIGLGDAGADVVQLYAEVAGGGGVQLRCDACVRAREKIV